MTDNLEWFSLLDKSTEYEVKLGTDIKVLMSRYDLLINKEKQPKQDS